ncbi:MAG: hypothetical protein WC729_01050 [Sphingomonas sp.]|jgi:hypothetical protein|uniref:hypothetical protein n=1 Tax=Sphingomonas sp. TaxID=28214 RepID=UPI003566D6CA
MHIILVALESIGLVLGSLALAGLLNGVLWSAFRWLRHPDWAWTVIAVPVVAVLAGAPPRSAFLRLALAFAAMLALPFWMEGRAWRSRWRLDHPLPAPIRSKPSA